MAIDAEYTITSPIASSSSAAQASVRSWFCIARVSRGNAPSKESRGSVESRLASLRMRRLLRMRRDEGLESVAALDVIAEHVEACACRRQQNNIARARMRDRTSHSRFERRCELDDRRHTGERGGYPWCVAPQQHHRAPVTLDT